MALLNGSIVYAHPNVTNGYLRFTYKNLSYNLQLENGIYDMNALHIAFKIYHHMYTQLMDYLVLNH